MWSQLEQNWGTFLSQPRNDAKQQVPKEQPKIILLKFEKYISFLDLSLVLRPTQNNLSSKRKISDIEEGEATAQSINLEDDKEPSIRSPQEEPVQNFSISIPKVIKSKHSDACSGNCQQHEGK